MDETRPGAVSLANYLTAAIGRIATRQKLEAGFDRRIRFLLAALAESKWVVPMMARLRLRELPLTKGLLFAGQWTPTMESTTKTRLLSVSQAQLVRDQPSTLKSSGDRFRIPFKKGGFKIIRPPMAPGYVRSVCAADCNQGLQDRVHGQSSKNNGGPVYFDPLKPGKTPGPRTRPRVNAGETSDRGNPPLNGRSRVLFSDLPGGQGIGHNASKNLDFLSIARGRIL